MQSGNRNLFSDWREVRLADVANITTGKRPLNKTTYKTGDNFIPVYGGNGVSWFTNEILIEEPVVITGRVGTIGTVYKVIDNCWVSDNALILAPRKNLNYYFLYYLMLNYDISVLKKGSTQPLITQTDVGNILVNIPPLEEQVGIAGVLGALDDKIEANRKQNETLEATAAAIFKSWFIDFEPFAATIPSDWKEKSLPQIADYLNGLALQKYPVKGTEAYLPVIKIAELNRGITENTDEASIDIPPEYIVHDGDVLFSWSGSLNVVLWSGGDGALNQHLFKVTSDTYPKWFYYLWTKHYLPFFQMIAQSKATTMGHIKREHLDEAKVIVPDSDTFDVLDKLLSPIIDKIVLNSIQSRTLSQTRDSLLPRLMSGKITIPATPKDGE